MATNELRFRGTEEPAPEAVVQKSAQGEKMTKDDVVEATKDVVPPFLQPVLAKLAPVVAATWTMLDAAGPHIEKAFLMGKHYWALAQPYHPEEFVPILFGFIMCFFGGSFMLLIAAVEAFRITGYEKARDSLQSLYEDWCVVKAASDADDLLDENNDGVADVNQISKKELLSRKVRLAIRTVDPAKVMAGLNGVLAGMMAVVATLKLRFAKSITLGSTIGGVLAKFTERYVGSSLRATMPEEYHKWISPGVLYLCQSVGVMIAYTIEQIMSMWHSSIRGGQLFAIGALGYAQRNGFAVPGGLVEGSPAFTSLTMALAGLGFYCQISFWSGLPFPFNIVLLPVRIVEYILTWAVYLHN